MSNQVVADGVPCIVAQVNDKVWVAVVKGESGYSHLDRSRVIFSAGTGDTAQQAAKDCVDKRYKGMVLELAELLHQNCNPLDCTNDQAVPHIRDAEIAIGWSEGRRWQLEVDRTAPSGG